MHKQTRITEVLRWVVAPCVSVVAFFAVLYFSLLVLFSGAFPPALAEPTASFVMAFVVVLPAALIVPRYHSATAVALSVIGILVVGFILEKNSWVAAGASVVAVALVAWWFHSQRTGRSVMLVLATSAAMFFAFIGVIFAVTSDRPTRPDPLPESLQAALGTNAPRVAAFYEYDLGGFIDHEWLWRIDAESDVVALIVATLKLERTNTVPQRFWRMSPHYWPRSMPALAEEFQSQAFAADTRGPDGNHYFLLHDKNQRRAYVWYKSNF